MAAQVSNAFMLLGLQEPGSGLPHRGELWLLLSCPFLSDSMNDWRDVSGFAFGSKPAHDTCVELELPRELASLS